MNSNDIELSAGAWLARLDRGNVSDGALKEFAQWKSADPLNAAAYARLAAAWQALDRVQAIRPSGNLPIDDDYFGAVLRQSRVACLDAPTEDPPSYQRSRESLELGLGLGLNNAESSQPTRESVGEGKALAAHLSGVEPESLLTERACNLQPPAMRSRKRWLYPWASAAFVASMAATFATFWWNGQPKTYSTGVGGFQHIVLADNSAIDLNTDTEVRVALSKVLRDVELVRGEASFAVAHDTSRPFIVKAGGTAVRAVGTKFDVHRLGDSVEVTVDEGKVAIGEVQLLEAKVEAFPPNIPQLIAGQTATASGEGVKLKQLAKNELAQKLSWQNQTLAFDSDTLADVVAQFNRYNTRQLVIADPKISAFRIGGYFRPTNLDAFISVLQSDFGISAEANGNQLRLSPAVIAN